MLVGVGMAWYHGLKHKRILRQKRIISCKNNDKEYLKHEEKGKQYFIVTAIVFAIVIPFMVGTGFVMD